MMNRQRHNSITATSRLCLLLLCILMGGSVNEVWAEGVITASYYYQENTGGSWTSENTDRYTVTTTDGYTQISPEGNGNNGTRVYTSSTNVVLAGVSYILQFDIKITGGTDQPSWFQVNDATNMKVNTGGGASNTTATSILQLAQSAAGSTTWNINGSTTQTVVLDADKWYTFKVHKTYNQTFLTITDRSTSSAVTGFDDVEITTNSTVGGLGNMEFATKRYSSSLAIDNISVQKWGWAVPAYNVSLTSADNDNKVSPVPELYNPGSGAVTYSYDGTVLSSHDPTYSPSPRLKATGTGTVTATIGGRTTQYSLTVTSATGGGTYDNATNTYTFNTVGVLANHTVSDVAGVSLTFDGGQTAVVVNDGTRTVVKVIDGNGYSHPYDLSKAYPTMGTYYRFVPTANGKLTISGTFSSPVLHTSTEKTNLLTANGSNYEANLEVGKIYYLYQDNYTPMLHSFKYELSSRGLTFRNPQALITVDVGEGSYTNPAISAAGEPVSYTVLSGPGSVNNDGKVTFTGSYFTTPQPIVVKASAGSDAVAYTINLVKNTWIFNENSLWSTTESDLGSNWDTRQAYTGNGLDGSTFCREKNAYNFTELTIDGTNVLPEMRGLLVSKSASTDRLYIAPNGYTPNFLAMRATLLAIDGVQTGQTVTVDWRGGNSSAVLDLQDAAGENVTGKKGGTLTLTATETGRVQIASNPIVAYINSIKVSTPTRAIGTLTYDKTVLTKEAGESGEVINRTGYTITDEAGVVNLREAYGGPGNFKSSNESVATVDGSGNITAVGVGTAIITATATAKSSATHQATVTLVALVEVVADGATRIRTIDIDDLKYVTNKSASNGLNRRIPGFDLKFEGGDGLKCNDVSSLLLRNGTGKMVIAPRPRDGETITITQAKVTVKSVSGTTPQWKVNGGSATTVSGNTVITLSSLNKKELTIESVSESIEITDIKLYYKCGNADNADYCLDESKVAPAFSFTDQHLMRVPADGRSFSSSPTLTAGDWFDSFDISYIYTSSDPAIATINSDGSNGQLLTAGASTISATFNETTYFAEANATYVVNNTLMKDETYDVSVDDGQFVHIQGSATANATQLTLSGSGNPLSSALTYSTTPERRNTKAQATGTITLKNETDNDITIDWVHVVTSTPRFWLYYAGQEENYKEQVQFKGFATGPIAGFRVMDVGDPYNPIDITDAYSLKTGGAVYETTAGTVSLSLTNTSTGESTPSAVGTATISHLLTKTGQADGYADEITATAHVNVLNFDDANPVVWNFQDAITDADGLLGDGWTHNGDYYYGYFEDYSPILANDNSAKAGFNGVLLKDEFRWYTGERALRANLSQPNSSIKFPVKAGMEIDVYVATSSADINHTISNVTDVYGQPTSTLFIQEDGYNNPIHVYYLAAADGCVEIKSTDKVGMYLKSVTLKVPEIHFTDEIVTQLPTGDDGERHVTNATTNIPDGSISSLSYTILESYTIQDDGTNVEDVGKTAVVSADSSGVVTLTGTEGWVTVKVTNNNSSRSALEPKEGTYKLYVVDLKFNPNTDLLSLDNHDGEDYFTRLPEGINKVVTPITYGYEIPAGSTARAMINQTTNANPALTTYLLTAYSKGKITMKASCGRITATCTLTVDGYAFAQVAPVLSDEEITDSYVFENELPEGFDVYNNTVQADLSGDITAHPTYTIENHKVKISNLKGKGHGAIRVTAKKNDDTSKTISFVLTIAHPASSGKRWDFYRHTSGLKDIEIGEYVGTHLNPQNVNKSISGTNTWTTNASWNKIYRNGDKEPRWAYGRSVRCDNAFIVEETAGLMIETAPNSFYVDNNSTASYYHVGLHNGAKVTIPKLKEGDFVRLNLSRVIPNNGAIIRATNVTDLAGKSVDEDFTITRSQIDYRENGVLATESNGTRIIPGYYTFITKADGDVSFMLADEGYLDVLSIEIYDATSSDPYFTNKAADGYQHTMLPVKLNTYPDYPDAPATILKEQDAEELLGLSFCHPLWSTSVGPAEYVQIGEKSDNLEAMLDNIGWYSAGGAHYVDGKIAVGKGYGKITVRMNNYTAEGKYLIGYTPDYTLTVGHKPHQDYPYTWNFTNISGGEVKGKSNNVYSSVTGDTDTWTNRGSDIFELDTNTSGGSFYVPGATLVSTPRDMGEKGTAEELTAAGHAADEFCGLGFSGQVMFKTESQSVSAREMAPKKSAIPGSMVVELLSYKMDDPNYTYKQNLQAGNGVIYFGHNKRETTTTTKSTCGYGFKCDGNMGYNNSTKYVLITPMRPFRVGDVITVKAFATSSSSADYPYGFSIYSENVTNAASNPVPLVSKAFVIPYGTAYKDKENTLSYTVTDDDGIAGLTSIFLFRNTNSEEKIDKGCSTYLNEITITGSYSALARKTLKSVSNTTVTIPDLNADGKQDWIYIKASREPKSITNATKVVDDASGVDDTADPVAGISTFKYKVTAPGNSEVTFFGETEIDQIGVTDIRKPLKKLSGTGWATESRERAIDHTLTGYFTKNDVKAYAIIERSGNPAYADDKTKTTVTINDERYVVPKNQGLVLKQPTGAPGDNDAIYHVPLFVPAITTAVDADWQYVNNLMRPNTSEVHPEQPFTSETETFTGMDGAEDYTRFILSDRYMTWRKQGEGAATYDEHFTSGHVAGFYRMHLFGDASYDGGTDRNTLPANHAYLLLRTDMINAPVWDTTTPAREYNDFVGIAGISDLAESQPAADMTNRLNDGRYYNLQGQVVEEPLRPGVYIRNGRKIAVK